MGRRPDVSVAGDRLAVDKRAAFLTGLLFGVGHLRQPVRRGQQLSSRCARGDPPGGGAAALGARRPCAVSSDLEGGPSMSRQPDPAGRHADRRGWCSPSASGEIDSFVRSEGNGSADVPSWGVVVSVVLSLMRLHPHRQPTDLVDPRRRRGVGRDRNAAALSAQGPESPIDGAGRTNSAAVGVPCADVAATARALRADEQFAETWRTRSRTPSPRSGPAVGTLGGSSARSARELSHHRP